MIARAGKIFWPLLALFPLVFLNLTMPEEMNYMAFQAVNFILGVFCVLRIFPMRGKCHITTDLVTYIFIYIFFVVAPLYQYKERVTFWSARLLTEEEFLFTTVLLLLAVIIYDLFYRWFLNKWKRRPERRHVRETEWMPRKRIWLLALAGIATAVTLYIYRQTPELLFFRKLKGVKIAEELSNTSINLLFSQVIRPIPVILTALYLFIYRKYDLNFLALASMSLISNFPLSLPRFYVAGVYIPLVFAVWKSLINRPLAFRLIMLVGILYIFPFLNQGRTVEDAEEIEFSLEPNYEMFLHGHFDAFQNGARVMMNDLVTWGNQLIGCIFFWVPRSMWPNKPIGSGGFIAEEFHLRFDHISVNYWAEGWINYGFAGMLAFSVILAFINARCDFVFWHRKHTLLFKYDFLLYLGMIIFILRGDMISSVAFIVGFLVSAYICYTACMGKARENKRPERLCF